MTFALLGILLAVCLVFVVLALVRPRSEDYEAPQDRVSITGVAMRRRKS